MLASYLVVIITQTKGVILLKKLIAISAITTALLAGDANRVVFDCSSGDMRFVSSRLMLIDSVANELKTSGESYDMVLTIHSGCTPISTSEIDDDPIKMKITDQLKALATNHGVKIEACEIALDRFGIELSDLPSHIGSVKNSITRVIKLQNSGYALIPFN